MDGIFSVFLLIAAVLPLSCAFILWSRRSGRASISLSLLLFTAAMWAAVYALTLTTPAVIQPEDWRIIEICLSAVLMALWMTSVLESLPAFRSFPRWAAVLILAEAPLLILLALTNPLHGLIWKNSGAAAGFGTFYWFHLVFVHLTTAGGIVLLISDPALNRSTGLKRLFLSIACILVPGFYSFLLLTGMQVYPDANLTPILIILACPVLAWQINHLDRRKVSAAYNAIILDNIQDEVLILNNERRIVAANLSFLNQIQSTEAAIRGKTIKDVLPDWEPAVSRHLEAGDMSFEMELGDEEPHQYREVRAFPLLDNNRRIGTVMLTQNITARKLAEKQLRQNLKETQALYRISQLATRPTSLEVMLQSLVNCVVDTLDANWALLVTLDLEQKKILHFYRSGPGAENVDVSSYEELMDGLSGVAVTTMKPLLSEKGQPDERETPHVRQKRESRQTGCIMVAPLIYQNRVLGTITAANREDQRNFTRKELEMLAALANQAAVGVENARLLESERRQRNRAETLSEVASTLTTSLSQEQLIDLILDQISRVLEYDSASLMLFQGDLLKIAAYRGRQSIQPVIDASTLIKLDHIQKVLREKTPYIIADTYKDPGWVHDTFSARIRSWLGVPLLGKEGVIGILNLDKEQIDYYTSEDSQIAMALANTAAAALENARLYESAQKRAQEAETLRQATSVILSTLNADEAIEQILEQLDQVVPFDSASVQLLDDDYLEVVGGRGWRFPERVIGMRFKVPGNNPNTLVIETRQPLIIDDAWNEFTDFEMNDPDHTIRSWMGIPLMVQDQPIGMITLDKNVPHFYTPDNIRMAQAFADKVAVAIENARLYQSAREAAQRSAVLHQVSQEIVAVSASPETIYQSIHNAARRLMPSEAFVITQIDPSGEWINAPYLVDYTGRAEISRIPKDQGLSGYVIATGESVLIGDVHEEIERAESILGRAIRFGGEHEVLSLLAVPMRLAGRTVGMISAQSYKTHNYTEEDCHLLEMLASYAAIALENHRLFKEVKSLAITDSLTEINNRRQLFALGQREFSRAARFGRPLSVVMIDIDHFKKVNDTFGHAAGDRVLRHLAQVLKQNVREIDVLGRYGGEEFVVVLPETELSVAYSMADRVRRKVFNAFSTPEFEDMQISVSIGVAEMRPDTPDLAAVIERADQALYQAKGSGRNRVVCC